MILCPSKIACVQEEIYFLAFTNFGLLVMKISTFLKNFEKYDAM